LVTVSEEHEAGAGQDQAAPLQTPLLQVRGLVPAERAPKLQVTPQVPAFATGPPEQVEVPYCTVKAEQVPPARQVRAVPLKFPLMQVLTVFPALTPYVQETVQVEP